MTAGQESLDRAAGITVAISTRSRAEALSRCVDALLSGSVLPAEIIVVDQSRDQKTRSLLEKYHSGRTAVRYIHHDGSGLAASQNIAFAQARSPIVAVTDDDCVPIPEWIAILEKTFSLPEVIDVVTGRVLPLGPEAPGTYAVASRTSSIRKDFDRRAMPWEIGSGNNFAARREWLLRIGGNDERLGPGSPGQGAVDIDLFYRLARAGACMRYEPEALVYHQRTDRAGRLARRGPYGFGMGAFCCIHYLQGDRSSLRVLFRWLSFRAGLLIRALRHRQAWAAYEEMLVLSGTLGGILHGLRRRHLRKHDYAS